jgi:phosphoribosyl 1,2-cyclic phosphate phosphodiesterase
VKITFLGTGTSQGVPVIACPCPVCNSLDYRDKRLRTSVHVQIEEQSFIIDCGPDFRQQVLRERIGQLDAILMTHQHKDHTAGLDDVRAFNFIQKKHLPVYGFTKVLEQLKQEFSYAFTDNKYPGIPLINLEPIENKPFKINNINITPIEVMHFKLPVLGYRFEDFTYITDAKSISNEELKKIRGSKVIVLNALQKEDHISHFTLSEAITLLLELKPEKAYLTHISHRMGLHKETEKNLPPFIKLAYDGLSIEI